MTDFEAAVFLIDKPIGPTSFAMVRKVRHLLAMKKVGHAGTLDPFASGLLIICAGRPATRMISRLMEGEKEYLATLVLGYETTTQDPEGERIATTSVGPLSDDEIEECLQSFTGEQMQTPPAYSALKHKGKPLYYYARRGIAVKKEARPVHIRQIIRIDGGGALCHTGARLELRVTCSKGTYIRTLAADIGRKLGCGAYLGDLRRTRSGIFSVDNSFPGDDLADEMNKERFLAGSLSVNHVSNLLQNS